MPAAAAMLQEKRWAVGLRVVRVSPAHQVHQGGPELCALCRQYVLVAMRMPAVPPALQNALCDQAVQARAQHWPADAEDTLELLEAPRAKPDTADDQQGPTLPDYLQRAGQGADLRLVVAAKHGSMVHRSVR